MEETEILEETAPVAEEIAEAYAEESAADTTTPDIAEAEENALEPSEDEAEPLCEEADAEKAEISAESFAKTLANPMFAVFARGRSGSIEDAVHDFEKMLAAGRESLSEEMLMKMTPGAVEYACGGAVLSERQRRIARDAGMSYREYYEMIRSIPTKK